MKRHSCYLLSLDFAVLVSAFLVMSSCLQNEPRRQPVRYLIPEGYVGWIKIGFGVPSEPTLPVEDGYLVCRIPPSGEFRTSSDIQFGWAKDEYYYYADDTRHLKATGWGGGGMIWGGFNGQELDANNHVVQTYLQFFVGSEDDYKKHIGPPGLKKTGPIER